ncbi:MAG: ATP-binding cassette domain-containing protein [Microscillaceae bacterium]|nr:ATP-binding cassette domain-containing protein [Microscillaceae bacterium]
MDDIALRVENLSKAYPLYQKKGTKNIFSLGAWSNILRNRKDHFWALQNINFEVKKGEVLGIIGPNGAGKSTLLKILARITEPTRGRIEIQGRVQALLEVGTGFHPELTGRENIFLNGAMLGMRQQEIRQKFEEIVDFSGVSAFIDTPVKYYSSGMYVRLAFSVAAHLDADILILDEVFAVGDQGFQRKAIDKLERINQYKEKALIIVSHNLGTIKRLCNRGLLIINGKIMAVGEQDSIISIYLNNIDKKDKINDFFSLKDKSRKGNQNITFTSLNFHNHIDNFKKTIQSGQELSIEIKYTLNMKVDAVKDIKLSIGILNNWGQPLGQCPVFFLLGQKN